MDGWMRWHQYSTASAIFLLVADSSAAILVSSSRHPKSRDVIDGSIFHSSSMLFRQHSPHSVSSYFFLILLSHIPHCLPSPLFPSPASHSYGSLQLPSPFLSSLSSLPRPLSLSVCVCLSLVLFPLPSSILRLHRTMNWTGKTNEYGCLGECKWNVGWSARELASYRVHDNRWVALNIPTK